MTDGRRDPEIVVFGVEDDVRADPSGFGGSAYKSGREFSAGNGLPAPPGDERPDEIRQGDDPDHQRHSVFPGLAHLRSRIETGGRRLQPRHIAVAVTALVVVAFVGGVLVGRRSSHTAVNQEIGLVAPAQPLSFAPPTIRFRFSVPNTTPVAPPDTVPGGSAGPRVTVAASQVYAMQLKATPVNRAGQSEETRDAGADHGPWSVIVRRSDGSLGHDGAVVTYPVPPTTTGPAVKVGVNPHRVVVPGANPTAGAVVGHMDVAGGIVWPVNGKFARIRGDLGLSTLAAIASRVSTREGHPVVTDLPKGYRVLVSEPYRAPVVTQSRYSDSVHVGSGPIDGLIYSEVVIGGASFEEALYSETTVPGANIGGHRAISSSVGGGNATLAWEVAPGIVALVGDSGGLVASTSAASLTELARGGHLLGHAQWTATRPITIRGENDYV